MFFCYYYYSISVSNGGRAYFSISEDQCVTIQLHVAIGLAKWLYRIAVGMDYGGRGD